MIVSAAIQQQTTVFQGRNTMPVRQLAPPAWAVHEREHAAKQHHALMLHCCGCAAKLQSQEQPSHGVGPWS